MLVKKPDTPLKRLRLRMGLTQVELCALLGVAQSSYSLMEAGKRSINIEVARELVKIAKRRSIDIGLPYFAGHRVHGRMVRAVIPRRR